ncbi:MAG: biotin--[acetyl-CoA-carboxylase] ligase [Phycisphaerales bacterium]
MRTIRLESTDSTMLEARRRLAAGETTPFVIVATEQSGGVGRLGRKWSSPRGGWWLTIAVALVDNRRSLRDDTTLQVALWVHTFCCAVFAAVNADHSALRIKWPNDVMAGDLKLAGILTEVVVHNGRPVALFGIGVNADVNLEDLDEAVRTRAMTLRTLIGAPVPAELVRYVLETLPTKCAEAVEWPLPPGGAAECVRPLLWGVGRTVPITLPGGARVVGRIEGITDDGNLLATINGEQHVIRSVEELG